ncbi:MAG: hypothetical protein N3D20_02410 [Candidatus Pacearchaeota archaeon]|nr:hypothetical protein [Candidatus Pacearchaeota archaeon]
MAKKTKTKKNRQSIFLFLKLLWFVVKIPYYLIKGIIYFIGWSGRKIRERKIMAKKGAIKPVYEDFKIIEALKGDFKIWEENLAKAESKIGIILGARGSGKTAIGVKLLENIYAKTKKKCYAMGFKGEDFPLWINVVDNIDGIKNNSVVLIDEGGILFSSRNSMSDANKLLSNLILIARHKNLSIIFISQNSSNLDVNILRQADFLILKPSSLLQKEFERKIIQEIYEKTEKQFERYKCVMGLTHIYSNEFEGFVANPLPSFWDANISKSFR